MEVRCDEKTGIIATVLVLLVSGLAFAQLGGRGPGRFENLTEEQTAELASILEQMESLRTQMRESMAEYRAQAMEALEPEEQSVQPLQNRRKSRGR